jgi:hypothetical protein
MYLYTGAQTKTFFQYLDGATGSTLVAEPGNVYHIVPTSPDCVVPPYGSNSFVLVENEPDEDRHDLDRMTDESGVDHTESDGE